MKLFWQDDFCGYMDAIEIPIVINVLEQDIKTIKDWLNNPETKIKESANAYNDFNGKTIHEYIKEDKEKLKFYEFSLIEYRKKLLAICN